MRVNIYGEEITKKIEVVKKTVDQKLFVGVRFYLKSHPDLHHSESDNDESAITFWVPYTAAKGNNYDFLCDVFMVASELLEDHSARTLGVENLGGPGK